MARLWRRVVSNIRALFNRERLDRELDDELGEFVRMAVERHVADGMSPDEAHRAARTQFGSMHAVKEHVRDAGWESRIESLAQDLRYAARMLYRRPAFTAVAIFALALGIGVNTAVFTAYRAMVVRPLDARDPARMVNIAVTRPTGAATFAFSYLDYETYRDAARSFSGLIAFSPDRMTLSDVGSVVSQRTAAAASGLGRLGLLPPGAKNTEFASTFVVSENYFAVLGVAALSGRTFESLTAAELTTSPAVLISENYWRGRFAGDPAIIGTTVHLNGAALKVIGVTPPNFVGTSVAAPDFWLPASLEPLVHPTADVLRDREDQRFRMYGRLAPGERISDAQAELTPLVDSLRMQHEPHSETARPGTVVVWRGSPFPLPLKEYAGLTQTILLIMIAAAMVLVVACANVGSLQLARVQSRQSELRTRLSLGAGRIRIIRQLLTESALLGLMSGATALVVTWILLKLAVRATASAIPVEFGTLVFDVTPDLTIFGFVLGISLVAAMLFGVLPAIESSGVALAATVRTATSPARSRRLQDLLVTAQVALSLVLLIAGSLFVRSALHSLHADAGYDSKQVADVELQFPDTSRYPAERRAALTSELRERIAELPAVTRLTSAIAPDANTFQTAAVAIDGAESPAGAGKLLLHYSYIEANYFQTLGVPVLQGRGFAADASEDVRSVILSQSAAKHFWPGQSAIGRTLRLGATDERRLFNATDLSADGPAYQVIGVARDTRGVQFNGSDSRQIYLSLPVDWRPTHPMLVRTASDTAELGKAIDAVAASVDPELVATVTTLDDRLRHGGPFLVASLAAAIALAVGLVGLVLAMMGIHGTVSYVVVLRTREVGIRMAIGAERRDILGLILRESVRPVVAGLGVGLLLAVGASFLLKSVLFGLSALDGVSFGVVSVLFLLTALAAAYAPSRRATRVNPVVALRHE